MASIVTQSSRRQEHARSPRHRNKQPPAPASRQIAAHQTRPAAFRPARPSARPGAPTRYTESGHSSDAAPHRHRQMPTSSQLQPRAVNSRRLSSSRSPTTTRRDSGSIRTTNFRSPNATPKPFRCPTVKLSIPSCSTDDRAVSRNQFAGRINIARDADAQTRRIARA